MGSGVEPPNSGEFANLDDCLEYLKSESAKPLAAPPPVPTDPPELYNIESDPHETRNVAGEHPEIARTLAGRLDAWFERNRPEWERCRADDPYGMKQYAEPES
jgi:hypothetical protein